MADPLGLTKECNQILNYKHELEAKENKDKLLLLKKVIDAAIENGTENLRIECTVGNFLAHRDKGNTWDYLCHFNGDLRLNANRLESSTL